MEEASYPTMHRKANASLAWKVGRPGAIRADRYRIPIVRTASAAAEARFSTPSLA
jgi:hypothetical protein